MYRLFSYQYGLDPGSSLKYEYGKAGILPINTGRDVERIVKSKTESFISCGAEWCGSCLYSAGEIISLKKKYKNVKFYYLDIDNKEATSIVGSLFGNFNSVPYYIIIYGNGNYATFTGSYDNLLEEIETKLK